MTRLCTCDACKGSAHPVTLGDPTPPRGPAGISPPAPPPAVPRRPKPADAQLRVEALRAAIDVHRLAAERDLAPPVPLRQLAEDYHRWLSTGSWG
jgi:hypothetical protein